MCEGGSFWTDKGARGSFPRVSDRAGPTEGVGTEVSDVETAQAEFPDSPDTLGVTLSMSIPEPGCHNDPRLLRSARSYARLVRQTPSPFHPLACSASLLIAAKRTLCFAPPPPVESLSGDGLSRIEVDASERRVTWLVLRVCRCCGLLSEDASFFVGQGCRTSVSRLTEVEGTKVSSKQALWPMCFAW